MTDAIITALAKIPHLGVISRTSVMAYKNARKILPQIARELRADALLEGAIVRSGDRVRITVQLLDATIDQHLWAESYDRELVDKLKLHEEVSHAIAAEVPSRLSRSRVRSATAFSLGQEAYNSYLKGRYLIENTGRNDDGLKKATVFFEEAVNEAPLFAQAYAGIAESYDMSAIFGLLPTRQASAKAQQAARRAIEIDPSISEAHAAAKTLFKKTANLRLITVMIGWSQQSSGRPFARNAAEIALDWIVQGHVGGIKLLAQQAESRVFESQAIRRNGIRFAQAKKRARVLRFNPDVIALRFLQKQTRQRINRIRCSPGFDLGCNIFKRGCLREKMDVELWQHRRRLRLASRGEIARMFPFLAIERLAIVPFSSITPTAILLVAMPVTRWTTASVFARARPRLLRFFFKSGMTRRGPIFLHPCREEFQVNQIEWLAGRWHLSHLLHQVEK